MSWAAKADTRVAAVFRHSTRTAVLLQSIYVYSVTAVHVVDRVGLVLMMLLLGCSFVLHGMAVSTTVDEEVRLWYNSS